MKVYIKNLQRLKRLNQLRIQRDIRKALCLLGLGEAELSIVFVNSSRMRLLNARHRGIDKVTDVLSFPMIAVGQKEGFNILGDIAVCIPKAVSQASEYRVPFYAELMRLLIHGLLHLLGYDHEKSSYQKKKMEKKEEEILNAVTKMAKKR